METMETPLDPPLEISCCSITAHPEDLHSEPKTCILFLFHQKLKALLLECTVNVLYMSCCKPASLGGEGVHWVEKFPNHT